MSALGTGVTPWILGGVLDVPLETMGKRKHHVAQAQHLGHMARFELAITAWLAHSRVRHTLLDLQTARPPAPPRTTHRRPAVPPLGADCFTAPGATALT